MLPKHCLFSSLTSRPGPSVQNIKKLAPGCKLKAQPPATLSAHCSSNFLPPERLADRAPSSFSQLCLWSLKILLKCHFQTSLTHVWRGYTDTDSLLHSLRWPPSLPLSAIFWQLAHWLVSTPSHSQSLVPFSRLLDKLLHVLLQLLYHVRKME